MSTRHKSLIPTSPARRPPCLLRDSDLPVGSGRRLGSCLDGPAAR